MTVAHARLIWRMWLWSQSIDKRCGFRSSARLTNYWFMRWVKVPYPLTRAVVLGLN